MRNVDSKSRFVHRVLGNSGLVFSTAALRSPWLAQGALAIACVTTMQLSGCVRGSGRDVAADLREEGTKAAIQASDEIEARKRETSLAGKESKKVAPSSPALASADPVNARTDRKSRDSEAPKNPIAEYLEREGPAAGKREHVLAQADATRRSGESGRNAVSQANAEWEALLEEKLAIARQRARQEASPQVAVSEAPGFVSQTSGESKRPVLRQEAPVMNSHGDAGRSAARPFPGMVTPSTPAAESVVSTEPSPGETSGFNLPRNVDIQADLVKARPKWMAPNSLAETASDERSGANLTSQSPNPSDVPAGQEIAESADSARPAGAEWAQATTSDASADSEGVSQSQPSIPQRGNAVIANSLKDSFEQSGLMPAAKPAADAPVNKLLPRRDLAQAELPEEPGLPEANASMIPKISPQQSTVSGDLSLSPFTNRHNGDRLRVQALMSQAHSMMDRGELREAYRTALEAQQAAKDADIAFSAQEEQPDLLADHIADLLWGPGLRGSQTIAETTSQEGTQLADSNPLTDPHEATRNGNSKSFASDMFRSAFEASSDQPNWRPSTEVVVAQHEPVDLRRSVSHSPAWSSSLQGEKQVSAADRDPGIQLTPDSSHPLPPQPGSPDLVDQERLQTAVVSGNPFRRHSNLGPIRLTNIESADESSEVSATRDALPVVSPGPVQKRSSGGASARSGAKANLAAPPIPAEFPEIARTSGERIVSAGPVKSAIESASAEEPDHGLVWAMVGFCAAALSTIVGLRLHRKRCEECTQTEGSAPTLKLPETSQQLVNQPSGSDHSARAA